MKPEGGHTTTRAACAQWARPCQPGGVWNLTAPIPNSSLLWSHHDACGVALSLERGQPRLRFSVSLSACLVHVSIRVTFPSFALVVRDLGSNFFRLSTIEKNNEV